MSDILKAVIATLTALILGGVITACGRLQLRFQVRVAVYDKMPTGGLSDELAGLTSRMLLS